jgi:iron complex outermembrane receptor protein
MGKARWRAAARVLVLFAVAMSWVVDPTPGRAETGGAQPGGLTGTVVTADGRPAGGVAVTAVDAIDFRRSVRTDADGRFVILGLPAGSYLIEAQSGLNERATVYTKLDAGAAERLVVRLSPAGVTPSAQIVITGTPVARRQGDLVQPVDVLSGSQLDTRVTATLGETLSGLPGVSSTFFGRGASRPIIRGLGGDRVRILDSGVGSFDVSDISDDHAVPMDPLTADRIEIVRGPATLLYGSSAIGGVVNVITDRIARQRPDAPLTGTLEGAYATNAKEGNGKGAVNAMIGDFVVHLDGFKRDSDDYGIPHSGNEPSRQPNSYVFSDGGGVGVSYVGEDAYFGVAGSQFNSTYGIPSIEGAENSTSIKMRQSRVDLEAGYANDFLVFSSAKARLGIIDYKHDERDNGDVSLTFRNKAVEGRVDLNHKPIGPFTGTVGFQVINKDFSAVGEEESFLQPTKTFSGALFVLEQLEQGDFTHQFGLRSEIVNVEPSEHGFSTRNFVPLSGSIGTVWHFTPGYSAGASLTASQRAPSAQELFAFGAHDADGTFQIGNHNLNKETALGGELSLRKETGRVTATVNGYANYFLDFIWQQPTGEEMGDPGNTFPAFRFVQNNALFVGSEGRVAYDFYKSGNNTFGVDTSAQFVRATFPENGKFVPRIPAAVVGGGLYYKHPEWDARLELRHTLAKDQTATDETRTGGFTFLNASLAHRVETDVAKFDLVVSGNNLLNQRARDAVSFLKDEVLLPGRDVRFLLRARF